MTEGAGMGEHPETDEGIADEQEAELRALLEAMRPGWTAEVNAAGGGWRVEVRYESRVVRDWWRPDRLVAVNTAIQSLTREWRQALRMAVAPVWREPLPQELDDLEKPLEEHIRASPHADYRDILAAPGPQGIIGQWRRQHGLAPEQAPGYKFAT